MIRRFGLGTRHSVYASLIAVGVSSTTLADGVGSGATSAPQPATAATPAPTTPLGIALADAEGTEYAKAEAELAAIKGADRSTAQLALARVELEQGKFAEAVAPVT